MKDTGKKFMFFFCLFSGVIVGSLISAAVKNVSWLSWLAFGPTIGFGFPSPAVLDLSVFVVSLGISFSITVAHIISIGGAMVLYFSLRKQ